MPSAKTVAAFRVRGRYQVRRSGAETRHRDSFQGHKAGCVRAPWSPRGRSEGKVPADVKGRPVKPVRSTLDIGCLTGSKGRMNDPEVTMSNALTNTNLIAHEKALEAAGDAITLVMRVPAPLKSIADQMIRSASYWRAGRAVTHPHQRVANVRPPPTFLLGRWPQIAAGGEFGARKPLRGPRTYRKRPIALLENRLRVGQGSRQPHEASRSGGSGQPHQGREDNVDI